MQQKEKINVIDQETTTSLITRDKVVRYDFQGWPEYQIRVVDLLKVLNIPIDNISKDKYEVQYNNLKIINTDIFHDRFIIIDKRVLYHSGASFKDLGKKCFAITKMEDDIIIKKLLNKLKELK